LACPGQPGTFSSRAIASVNRPDFSGRFFISMLHGAKEPFSVGAYPLLNPTPGKLKSLKLLVAIQMEGKLNAQDHHKYERLAEMLLGLGQSGRTI